MRQLAFGDNEEVLVVWFTVDHAATGSHRAHDVVRLIPSDDESSESADSYQYQHTDTPDQRLGLTDQ